MAPPGAEPPQGQTHSDAETRDHTVKNAALAVDIVGIVFVALLFLLRMIARHVVTGKYGLDDVTCAIAFIGFIGYCSISIVMIHHGGGLHQWLVTPAETMKFSQIQAVYATMVIYGPSVFATKASILFFVTRVFKPYERYCRFVYAFMILMALYYTLMFFLKIFICRPIHKFWELGEDGQCFDQRALILADNVISLLSDLAVLFLPCWPTRGLKVGLAAKFRIAAVFGAGGIACICSFIRLLQILQMASSPDQTYAFTLINLWGVAEVGIGLVCACFPVMPAFWKYMRHSHHTQTTSYTRSRTNSRPSGIELNKKSHQSRSHPHSHNTTNLSTRLHKGSDENMLVPQGNNMTTSVYGGSGEALDLNKMESGGAPLPGASQKQSYEDQGIVRTVEVQVHESLGKERDY